MLKMSDVLKVVAENAKLLEDSGADLRDVRFEFTTADGQTLKVAWNQREALPHVSV